MLLLAESTSYSTAHALQAILNGSRKVKMFENSWLVILFVHFVKAIKGRF